MKQTMQQVLARVSDEQARLIWELLGSFVEDAATHEWMETEADISKVAGGTVLLESLDAVMASYAEEGK